MELRLIGPHPFARDEQGQQLTRIGTLFPKDNTLLTEGPGVHAWQRWRFIETQNEQRLIRKLPPLNEEEETQVCSTSVDLVFDSEFIFIRPDPEQIELAIAADELLHSLVSKRKVKFLSLSDPRVREALKRRGECWRLSSIPKTREEKKRLIFASKVAITGQPIYFYNRLTGTRWLTFQEFERLRQLDDATLVKHLAEIAAYAQRTNRLGRPEIDFFAVELGRFGIKSLAAKQFDVVRPEELRSELERLVEQFRSAVHETYRRDDPNNKSWSARMLSTLFLEGNESQTEQILSGLSPEFFMQVEWLPGGRFKDGEFLVDPVFEEAASRSDDAELQRLCDPRAKEIILNLIREYGDLEYINLGCIRESLSLDRPQREGRRGVYLAEFHVRDAPAPVRQFLRLQKWGVWEHLDEGKDLLASILESDEYSDYSLDRRLGCRQLGMNLCRRVVTRRLNEVYQGTNERYRGRMIRTTYFEREYLPGIATDKLPLERYQRPGYALKLASLLGAAAAANLIVGRSLDGTRPAFDDGDEVVREGEDGLPSEILVADHSGAFTEYELPLVHFAADYSRPVNVREAILPQARHFGQIYLDSLGRQLAHVQGDYRERRRAFDHLFKHCKYDPAGSFAYRWECVLRRLDATEVDSIVSAIGAHIRILSATGNPQPAA